MQKQYLGIKIVDSRGGDRDSPVFQLKSVPQSELLSPPGHLPVAEYRACKYVLSLLSVNIYLHFYLRLLNQPYYRTSNIIFWNHLAHIHIVEGTLTCELMSINPASPFNVNCTLRVPCTSPESERGSVRVRVPCTTPEQSLGIKWVCFLGHSWVTASNLLDFNTNIALLYISFLCF